MDDSEIIAFFNSRSEQAIKELSAKYGAVCAKLAGNILNNRLDVEECLNDAYLGVWNTIPPNSPECLLSYVLRIVRNTAIAKYHKITAQKRNSSYDVALDELEGCIAGLSDAEDELTANELSRLVNQFLDSLPQENRVIFIRRYWYADSVKDISKRMKLGESNVSVRLLRIRKSLQQYLMKEGYKL